MCEGAREGWGWPPSSERWHYFRMEGGRLKAICGSDFLVIGDLYEAPEKDAEVCRVCLRMRAKGVS